MFEYELRIKRKNPVFRGREGDKFHEMGLNKVSTYLIPPFVYDRHVNIINKHSHLSTRRWSVCVSHSFVDVTLDRSLFIED